MITYVTYYKKLLQFFTKFNKEDIYLRKENINIFISIISYEFTILFYYEFTFLIFIIIYKV